MSNSKKVNCSIRNFVLQQSTAGIQELVSPDFNRIFVTYLARILNGIYFAYVSPYAKFLTTYYTLAVKNNSIFYL